MIRSSSRARGRVRGLLELLRDEPVRAPEERLGRAVELVAEAAGGLLANRLHAVLELERARLAQPLDLARGLALELGHLAPLELGERGPRSGARLGLRAVDLLADRRARAGAGAP